MRFKWKVPVGLAVAAGASLTLSTALPAFADAVVKISSDPFTNPGSQHQTEVEPDTFSFGSTIVSAFQVGRFASGGASDIGWATSTNSGASWSHGFLPGTTPYTTPKGPYNAVSDPSVAHDARHGVWLISYLGLLSNVVDVLASRSFNGLTWSTPVVVAANSQFYDKNWTVCDDWLSSKFYGHCYTEFDNASTGDQIQMSTSINGGLSWGPVRTTARGAHGIAGQPLAQPSGRVVVPILGLDSATITLSSFISTDGGSSWMDPVVVTPAPFHRANGGLRDLLPVPSAEIDKAGRIYVVWQDCRFRPGCAVNDLVVSTTSNGLAWTTVSRIPIDPVQSSADHFIPGLAVDRTSQGHLGLAFYFYPNGNCTSATCQLSVGYLSSTNGGASWSAREQLGGPMNLTWLANTSQGYMVGDYISTSITPDRSFPPAIHAHPVVAGANPPVVGRFDEAMYTTHEEVAVTSGGLLASGSDVVVAPAVPTPATTRPEPTLN